MMKNLTCKTLFLLLSSSQSYLTSYSRSFFKFSSFKGNIEKERKDRESWIRSVSDLSSLSLRFELDPFDYIYKFLRIKRRERITGMKKH